MYRGYSVNSKFDIKVATIKEMTDKSGKLIKLFGQLNRGDLYQEREQFLYWAYRPGYVTDVFTLCSINDV